MTPISPEDALRFARLFRGRTDVYGVGIGGVRREPLELDHYRGHLEGRASGIGVFPLLASSSTCWFAAIDLDSHNEEDPSFEENFELARCISQNVDGTTWLERSRSGRGIHLFAFFTEPIEAWVARGHLRVAADAAGAMAEVFPKTPTSIPGRLPGGYLNLPIHGSERPILTENAGPLSLAEFLAGAEAGRTDPVRWLDLCRQAGIESPCHNESSEDYGRRPLHRCARYILGHSDENPPVRGSRNVLFWSLAKQFGNARDWTEEETTELLLDFNAKSADPLPESSIEDMVRRAIAGEARSTGCDDPLLIRDGFFDPQCPIAQGEVCSL